MHKKTSCFSAGILLAAFVNTVEAKTLKACTVAWPPFVTVDGGKIAGADTNLLQEAAKKMGFDGVSVADVPWKRCLKMAEDGDVDIVYPASQKPDRSAYLYYPKTALHPVAYVFATKVGVKEEWTTKQVVGSLPQPIGIPLGYSIADQLIKEKDVTVDKNAMDDKTNVQKLVMGRVGTIIIEKINGHEILKELKVADKIILLDAVPYFKDKEYYITVSKKSPNAAELIEKLDKVLPGIVPKNTG